VTGSGGGQVTESPDGNATIDFTGGSAPVIPPFSTAPVSVSRAINIDEVSVPVESPASGNASGGAEHPQGAQGGADPEEMYEQVLSRLRRDLRDELELTGRYLHDHL